MNEIGRLEEAFKDMGVEEEVVTAEVLPDRCFACLNNTICSPLLSFLTLNKIGIKLQVDLCAYFRSVDG